jgi:beta-glucosidase
MSSEEKTVNELLSQLTLRQKVGQMTMGERMHLTPGDVKEHFLGAVLSGGGSHPGENTPGDWADMNDAFWEAACGDDHNPCIPILFGIDAVHGHNNLSGATIFPHNIGLGAARDPGLIARIAEVTASEILASGIEWDFAPTLAVARNPQWGRTYESFGDDPELIAKYGEAYVTAMQNSGVLACVKHWAGDGATSHGIDQGDAALDWTTLEAEHISPYYPSLDAGVGSVMVSFNSWNGQKCHGNRFLITEVLKQKLGFDGIVVSDWDGIDYLDDDYEEAIRKSVNAGIDMFMVPEKWKTFLDGLIVQVENGNVPMDRIDDAVTRILRIKVRYGLFESLRPSERPGSTAGIVGVDLHRETAREAVRKSLVLLKNDENILPLTKDQRILVAGKSAHDIGNQCGGWTVSWQGTSGNDHIEGESVFDGITHFAPNATLSANLDGAEADASKHDVAIVVIGETPYAEGFGDIRPGDDLLIEAGSMIDGSMNPLKPYGRSLALSVLHPEDLACIRRIASANVPVVVLLVSGRPLVINEELALSSAFVAAWLPGSEGSGVAEVLFGEYDFEGRLPLPWPNSAETIGPAHQLFPREYGLRMFEKETC